MFPPFPWDADREQPSDTQDAERALPSDVYVPPNPDAFADLFAPAPPAQANPPGLTFEDLFGAPAPAPSPFARLAEAIGGPGAPAPAASVVFTKEQKDAGAVILAAVQQRDPNGITTLTLAGRGGSGKTTLVRWISAELRAAGFIVEFMAPTGKAALRLRELTGELVTTIHQRFYGSPKEFCLCPFCREAAEAFTDPKTQWPFPCPSCKALVPAGTAFDTKLVYTLAGNKAGCRDPNFILVCDEASMVAKSTGNDVRAGMVPGQVLFFVGDDNQLPPIDEEKEQEEGPPRDPYDLWAADFRNPTARLMTVHRQGAQSPVLATANRIADDIFVGALPWPDRAYVLSPPHSTRVRDCGYHVPGLWLAQERQAGRDATLVTWTHRDRHALNAAVREARGQRAIAERLGVQIVAGDYLLCKVNQGGYLNGEVLRVLEHATPCPDATAGDRVRQTCVRLRVAGPMSFGEASTPRDVWVLPDLLTAKNRWDFSKIQNAGRKASKQLLEVWDDMTERRAKGKPAPLLDHFRSFEEYVVHTLGYDPERLLLVWWGEVLTCHSAQGSEFTNVGVVTPRGFLGRWKNDVLWSRRWLYTAVTRARSSLRIFELIKTT